MKVQNKKCIFNLSLKNMKSARVRNIVAVIAIALTTLLFTALFTIVMSISKGFEYSNFRQIGTCAHGEFKRLTEEQFNLFKNAEEIDEYGVRRVLGIGADEVLLKNYTEVSYMDKNSAEWSFLTPTTGRLPKENTNEAAADSRLLDALGVPKEIGSEFSVTIDVDGKETTESFVLCGWWEFDGASPASNILIPESRLEETFEKLDTQFYDSNIGSYSLTVMLKSDKNISDTMINILSEYGYSSVMYADNFIALGINWGYMSESLAETMDTGTIVAIAVMLLVIVMTGYLIIYNVFRISVSNEIRHYGMLKTIGTTGRQIRRIILIQAMTLSLFGIPLGLILGWGTGAVLSPIVINELNITHDAGVSSNPVIFVFAAIFAVVTVLISCFKPGKIAACVSPIEALRYTEATVNNNFRKGTKGVSIPKMAKANLAGSKGKTVLTIVSLSLSVVLFTFTVAFTNSFSMDKYLSNMAVDFQVSSTDYFMSNGEWKPETAIDDETIDMLENMDGVTDSFVTYGVLIEDNPQTFYSEDYVRSQLEQFEEDSSFIDSYIASAQRDENGLLLDSIQLLGMGKEGFSKIKVLEGDINKLNENGYIAVVKSDFFSLGDKVNIRYTDIVQYVNSVTGNTYTDFSSIPESELADVELKSEFHDVQYEICAVISIPDVLGYRYSIMGDLFLVNSDSFKTEIKNSAPLYIAFDAADESKEDIEQLLSSYTENSTLDYSSRAKSAEEFESFRRMFLILGGVLSFIVGLVGVLNFINTVLTGIITRRRELATLQAIGMTGKQLKSMLICEGLMYTAGAAITAVVLNLLTIPMSYVMEKIFWFCDYSFTVLPTVITIPIFAAIGIIVPTITYMIFTKKSVIERLRESE